MRKISDLDRAIAPEGMRQGDMRQEDIRRDIIRDVMVSARVYLARFLESVGAAFAAVKLFRAPSSRAVFAVNYPQARQAGSRGNPIVRLSASKPS